MTRQTIALATMLLLAACAGKPERTAVRPPSQPATPVLATPVSATPEPPPLPPAAPTRAADAGVARAELPALPDAAAALTAFRRSCPALLRREDRSGLTTAADWQTACNAAESVAPGSEATFFRQHFTAITVAGANGFATGYYEPEIAASRTRASGYDVPIYRRPADLIDVPLGDFAASLKGRTVRGRVAGNKLVPYATRADISAGALAGRGLEIAWAADPYEAFFLEIQGSGRLRLPDGEVLRIGYDGQNGRDYLAIGRLLIEQGRLLRGNAGMAQILAWLRANPADAPAVLNANGSKIFFRILTGEGPIGALNVPVTPRVSVAADPAFIPLGAPLLVDTIFTRSGERFVALMVAQDTGGAIKGANRIDLFLGTGAEAAATAGAQASPAGIILLIPTSAATRLIN